MTKNTLKYNAGFAGAAETLSVIAAPIIDGGIEFFARARSDINAVINPNIIKIYRGLIFYEIFLNYDSCLHCMRT